MPPAVGPRPREARHGRERGSARGEMQLSPFTWGAGQRRFMEATPCEPTINSVVQRHSMVLERLICSTSKWTYDPFSIGHTFSRSIFLPGNGRMEFQPLISKEA